MGFEIRDLNARGNYANWWRPLQRHFLSPQTSKSTTEGCSVSARFAPRLLRKHRPQGIWHSHLQLFEFNRKPAGPSRHQSLRTTPATCGANHTNPSSDKAAQDIKNDSKLAHSMSSTREDKLCCDGNAKTGAILPIIAPRKKHTESEGISLGSLHLPKSWSSSAN